MKLDTVKSICLIMFIVIVGSFAYVGAKEIIGHFALQNKLIEEQIVRLSDNVVSQRAELNTKLLEDRMKDLSTSIIALTKERGQEINDIGMSIAKLKQSVELLKGSSDKVYNKAGKDEHHYFFKKIYMKDADGNPFPVAWAMFYPNRPEDKQWKTGTYPLEFHERVVLAETDSSDKDYRLDVIGETWIENNQMKETRGQKFPVELESFDWVRRELKDKKWNFNPRLSIGFNGGTELFPSLNMSFFSYGKTKGDMDWKFLTAGVGGNADNFMMHLAPASYNLGKPLPLIDNIFIGPYLSIDSESENGFGVMADVPF